MLSARTVANLYDLHVAAVWRGDESSGRLGNWLEARWCEHHLEEPKFAPAAISFLGGGGSGIRWYEIDQSLVGFVKGRPLGCYVIDRNDTLPSISSVHDQFPDFSASSELPL